MYLEVFMEQTMYNFNGKLYTSTLTYLLTELSPSYCAATQELPSILENPKIHHRFHKSPHVRGFL
jgi:hypothetical protein